MKRRVTLFVAVSGAPTCCVPPIRDVNFISSPSQKFLCDNSDMLQILYILHLTATSAVALNEHRKFLFLHSFKAKCVNIAVIYILYVLKLKPWLRSTSDSKYILLRI